MDPKDENSPGKIPMPELPKTGDKKRKQSTSLNMSPDKSIDTEQLRPKRLISEGEKQHETARKKSYNEEYVKYLDVMMPKGNTSISSARIDRHDSDSKDKDKDNTVRIIGICGGAASGKTFIVKSIRNYLRSVGYQPTIIKERNFLLKIPCKDEDLTPEIISKYDFDSYKAVDWKQFENAIKSLSEMKPFNCPIYSLFQDKPIMKTKPLRPSNIILIEGRLFLNNEYLRNMSNFVIYLDTDSDIMLSRIIVKNEVLRKHTLDAIIEKYVHFIKPNFDKFVLPTKKYADMIIYNFAGECYHPEEKMENFQFLTMIKDWLGLQIKQDSE